MYLLTRHEAQHTLVNGHAVSKQKIIYTQGIVQALEFSGGNEVIPQRCAYAIVSTRGRLERCEMLAIANN